MRHDPPAPRAEDAVPPRPGWYEDPRGRFEFRYHNGQRWTADVARDGQRLIDPWGVDPAPPNVAAPRALPGHVAASVPPGWAHPGPPSRHPARTMAMLSMIFGIVAVPLAIVPFLFVVGAVGAVAAAVLGTLALRRIHEVDLARPERLDRAGRTGRRRAIAGITLAPVALALCVVGFAFTRVTVREIEEYTEPGPHLVDVDACTVDRGFATAEGTITNRDDRTRSYVIGLEYRDGGRVVVRRRVEVEGVAPGAAAAWSDARRIGADVGPTRLTCTVRQVTGPFPFGLPPAG